MDPVKGYEMCLRAAEISGGIVFPMMPIAPSVEIAPNGRYNAKLAGRAELRKNKI